ncbi:MAG: isoprenylcysteine carboxylmethyltransferase family protein [Xenococcaceae cyanobacterium MO_188.B19]|nr:isoprenylcysteine carboxylmethyltransferase family protein [Xenococcaceae cyanobacterium MO_188.B19]
MTLKIVGGLVVTLVFISIFWLAGGWNWVRGWAFIGLLIVGQTISTLYVWRKNPELLMRRSRIGQGTKTWDLVLLALFGITYLAIPIVAALDIQHHWSKMTIWLYPVGVVLYVFFMVVFTWAMSVNPHFEKTVRIQKELNHQVIESGPYRIVRHPGYIAAMLGLVIATPLLLGSWWAFIPAMLALLCLLLRTAKEDLTLRKELSGYEAYTRKVHERLLPGIW